MTLKPTRPEDILADDENTTVIQGQTVRKGSIAAVVANANVLASNETTKEQKQAALDIIKELAPLLVSVHEHIVWKNPTIEKIFYDAALQREK